MTTKQDDRPQTTTEEPAKQPYTPPELIVHGRVEEITANAGGGAFDGIFGSATGIPG